MSLKHVFSSWLPLTPISSLLSQKKCLNNLGEPTLVLGPRFWKDAKGLSACLIGCGPLTGNSAVMLAKPLNPEA